MDRSYAENDARATWLKQRSSLVTASDIGALFGIGYKSRDQLLDEKINGSTFNGNTKTYWGSLLEDKIFEAFQTATGFGGYLNGLKVYEMGSCGATPDAWTGVLPGSIPKPEPIPELEWCTQKRVPIPGAAFVPVQIKHSDRKHTKLRDYQEMQVQCELLCTCAEYGYLISKQGASTFRAWVVEPDRMLHAEMMSRAKAFMEEVRNART